MQYHLKHELGIAGLLVMYVGGLENHQGIDLLLESFAVALKSSKDIDLVIIGGEASDISKYHFKAQKMGIIPYVHFLEPKPAHHLAIYLQQSDILVSPRIKGNNISIKLYSYLDSGKPILATNLPTHTQLLNSQVAILSEPLPEQFAQSLLHLANNKWLRTQLGAAGQKLVAANFFYAVFPEKINHLFDWLSSELEKDLALV